MAGLTDDLTSRGSQNIAILGGGIGAISTAFLLTDPSLGGRYKVTIYCMGWRLGGKGASGRNPAKHQRVEEHGLHIWFGCYRNAIALIRACYNELDRPAQQAITSFADGFISQNHVVLTERVGDEWRPWIIDFPKLPAFPNVPTIYGLYELIRGYIGRNPKVARAIKAFRRGNLATQDREVLAALSRRDPDVHSLNRLLSPDVALGPDARDAEAATLASLAQSIWAALIRRGLDDDRDRRFWIITYLGITVARGILRDQLYEKGFDAVDGEEFRAWLSRHGSFSSSDNAPDELAFWSPVVQAFYDASFSYVDGDPNRPTVAASTALRNVLRILFDYSDSVIYKMRAGMGDTVFAPLYECLKKRGVQFNFFNRVTNLGLDSLSKRIESIEISRQVTIRGGREYDPLVTVGGLPCWPNQPLFDQIEEGTALAESGADLEHWQSGWTDKGRPFTLLAGQHFDRVVVAISHALLPEVAQELCEASPSWKAMVKMESVATQSWQLWFRRRRDELNMEPEPEIFGGFEQPWSSIVDFSHVLKFECWKMPERPHYLVYSSATLPSGEAGDPNSVKQRTNALLEKDGAVLWPGAYPSGDFDWSTLYAEYADNTARLDQQYFRGNTDKASLYVTAGPNTRHLRINANQTGFENLIVAGEWAETGVNISSIEATVISGMRAARAISGIPETIPGEYD